MDFQLRKGMKGEELLSVLRGHTSGESRQELVAFFETSKVEENPLPSHEVFLADETYALILKRHVRKNGWGHLVVWNEYFLSGVNDEGRYFVHTTNGAPEPSSLEDIVAWVNRADMGFSRRVQGDILISYWHEANIRASGSERTITVPISHTGNSAVRSQDVPMKEGITWNGLGSVERLPLYLGNHKLSSDGKVFLMQGSDTMIVVLGKELILEHPEHGMVREKIPDNHYAVIAGQRGRTFGLTGEGIVSGFD